MLSFPPATGVGIAAAILLLGRAAETDRAALTLVVAAAHDHDRRMPCAPGLVVAVVAITVTLGIAI